MKLLIFDCDGTIIDSQAGIVLSMDHAFRALELQPPNARRNALRRRPLAARGLLRARPRRRTGRAPRTRRALQERLPRSRSRPFRVRIPLSRLQGDDRRARRTGRRRARHRHGQVAPRRRPPDREGRLARPLLHHPDGRRASVEAASLHDRDGHGRNRRAPASDDHDRRHDLRHRDGTSPRKSARSASPGAIIIATSFPRPALISSSTTMPSCPPRSRPSSTA